jgi:hypothetical protein
VIRYHGGPIKPTATAVTLWSRRHAMVSFAYQEQAALAFEVAQSVMLDHSAVYIWTKDGADLDVPAVADFVRRWEKHPGCAGHLIPDKIGGTEEENDRLIASWLCTEKMGGGTPVWHLHESLDRLLYLVQCAVGRVYPAVALGSSGQWSTPGTPAWWVRMSEAMNVICDDLGRPRCKLHGLRMLAPSITARLPLASGDSTNIARNVGIDKKWTGTYAPLTSTQRALVMAERIEMAPAASRWVRPAPQVDLPMYPSTEDNDADRVPASS